MNKEQKDFLKLLGVIHIRDSVYHIPYLGEWELNTLKDLENIIPWVYNAAHKDGTKNGKQIFKNELMNLINN